MFYFVIKKVKYHEDFEKNIKNKHMVTGGSGVGFERNTLERSNKIGYQPALVATFKSGGALNGSSEDVYKRHGNFDNPSRFPLPNQQQQHQRKIGSIADYDPLGYENGGVPSGQKGYSNGVLHNGANNRSPTFSARSINDFVSSAIAVNGVKNNQCNGDSNGIESNHNGSHYTKAGTQKFKYYNFDP